MKHIRFLTDLSEFEVNELEQNLGTQAFSCDTLSVTEQGKGVNHWRQCGREDIGWLSEGGRSSEFGESVACNLWDFRGEWRGLGLLCPY